MSVRRSKFVTSVSCAASVSLACALGFAMFGGQGCLVTDKVEFGVQNVPATVDVQEPRGSIVNVQDEICKNQRGITFAIAISDLNVEDELFLRVVVDGVPLDKDLDIAVTGEAERAVARPCLRITDLFKNGPCSLVEFLVSRDFSGGVYNTRYHGDRGMDHILVGNSSDLDPQSPKSDCYTDAGAP